MAYEANRHNTEEEEERNNRNNAANVRAAASAAKAFGPEGYVIGKTAEKLDDLSGGAISNGLGKALTKANQFLPGGNRLQNLSNGLNESGGTKLIQNSAKFAGGGNTGQQSGGGEQSSSLPSSSSEKNDSNDSKQKGNGDNRNQGNSADSLSSREKPSKDDYYEDDLEKDKEKAGKLFGKFALSPIIMFSIILSIPLLIVIVVAFMASFTIISSDYNDGLGVNYTTGGVTGNNTYKGTQEQEEFYQRVQNVRLEMQANGKTVDPLKVVAAFHVLRDGGANLDYKDMTEPVISEFASAMFDGNVYSEETFRNNLIQTIIPKYIPNTTMARREDLADNVFKYIDGYYDYIREEPVDTSTISTDTKCSTGACSYDIKGFYLPKKGNVVDSMQISNLYVRLMQCGKASGHDYGGVFGQPLVGEELVPFEKYVLGVAYAEIGISSNVPKEAFKAQAVAARSYILARHLDSNDGWRTLKKEGDKWILQTANCTQDQVYCDPDKGCSSNSGQWGQIHSGLSYDQGYHKDPLPANSAFRTYAAQTSGEVLVNSQGYIIHTGYGSKEQQSFISLANSGLSYKEILIQTYNQGDRNYGASDVLKSSCEGVSECPATGEFTNWKQYVGSWVSQVIGTSGKTIQQIGCLVTSVAIQIARSGAATILADFNPGNFVQALNSRGGFSGGNFIWASASSVAPSFQFQDRIYVLGLSREQKLQKIKELTSQPGVYVVAEVKGNTGQHWVAIDSVNGDTVTMMDPGSTATDMWSEYNWVNTSTLSYFKLS